MSIQGTDLSASETGPATATVTFVRTGPTTEALTVLFGVGGTAVDGVDYTASPALSGSVQIPIGQASAAIVFTPIDDSEVEGSQTIALTLVPNAAYNVVTPNAQTITLLDDDNPVAQDEHPRTLLTSASRAALRASILANTNGHGDRWQDALDDFEGAGSYWAFGPGHANGRDPITCAYAAFLACVRLPGGTPSDDLGLTWLSSHATYITRITDAMATWTSYTSNKYQQYAIGLVYDLLYEHLDADQKAFLVSRMTTLLGAGTPMQWQSTGGHWNDQTSTQHNALTAMSIAMEDFADRSTKVLQEMIDWCDAHETMQNGEGLGYAWKNAYTANLGPISAAYMCRNAYGLSDAASVEHCLVSMRDAATQLRVLTAPHAGYSSNKLWMNVRMNFMGPDSVYHREANVGAFMLWATWLLPGRSNINPGRAYSHVPLANTEADLLAWFRHVSDQIPTGWSTERTLYRAATNPKWVRSEAPDKEKGHFHVFNSIIPWLIENVQLPTAKNSADAGLARVWRWWPDTLNWVTVMGGTLESGPDASLIVYGHRRYWSNNYTAGTYLNGGWQVFRGAPLLIKRGSASHGGWSKDPAAMNGTCQFFDTQGAIEAEWAAGLDADRGGPRDANSYPHYADMVADQVNDLGNIVRYYTDAKVVALASDLTRTYNCLDIQTNGAPKTSSYIKEFVVIQRGADGTDHEHIVEYSRIAVLGNGRYQPRVTFNPPLNPTIDGTETPFTPHFPDPNGVASNNAGTWKATGPVRWDYAGASKITFDNVVCSNPPFGGSGVGNGKMEVTLLRPSSTGSVVRKRGGLNQYWDPSLGADYDHAPHFDPFGVLRDYDGEWFKRSATLWHQQVGLYGVQVWHETFAADTRFLFGVDVMPSGATPATTTELTCDGGSVACRVGASAVRFKESNGTSSTGTVTIPAGVVLVVLNNLPVSTEMELGVTSTLEVTSSERTTSPEGVLVVEVTGAGVLDWSLDAGGGGEFAMTHLMGVGAVTETAATMRVRTNAEAEVQIEISPNSDMSGSTISAAVTAVAGDDFTAGRELTGLTPDTPYVWVPRIAGERAFGAPYPSFRTMPSGDADLVFVSGSCMLTPNNAVFASVNAENPHMVLHLGDFHYGDTTVLDTCRTKYKEMMTGDFEARILRQIALAGLPDDHDSGGNNCDMSLSGIANTRKAYKEYRIPYPLWDGNNHLGHSVAFGQAELFFLDVRNQRASSKPRFPSAGGTTVVRAGSGGTTVLVDDVDGKPFVNQYRGYYIQFANFTNVRRVLSSSYSAGQHTLTLDRSVSGLTVDVTTCHMRDSSMLDAGRLVDGQTSRLIAGMQASSRRWKLLITPTVWNPTFLNSDSWGEWGGGVPADRMEQRYIMEALADVPNILIASGDRHRSAIDDGTNSWRPEMTGSPFDQTAASLTGSWTTGPYGSGVQSSYNLLRLTSTFASIKVKNGAGELAAGTSEVIIPAA